jgi:hypothetical protein
MTEAEKLAETIKSAMPGIKSGTLRFWGRWFGRPYDNIHTIVGCEASGECLRVSFNEGETLSVWSPRGAAIDADTFRIGDADRVRWEWYYYGRPKTPENLRHEDFQKKGSVITVSTSVDWPPPHSAPDASLPAVEIL